MVCLMSTRKTFDVAMFLDYAQQNQKNGC